MRKSKSTEEDEWSQHVDNDVEECRLLCQRQQSEQLKKKKINIDSL